MCPWEGGTCGLMSAQAAISAAASIADARVPSMITSAAVGRMAPCLPLALDAPSSARRARSGRLVMLDLRAYALNRPQYRLIGAQRLRQFIKCLPSFARAGEAAVEHRNRRL